MVFRKQGQLREGFCRKSFIKTAVISDLKLRHEAVAMLGDAVTFSTHEKYDRPPLNLQLL